VRRLRFSLSFLILSSLTFLLVLTWFLLSLISFKTAESDLLRQKSDKARILLASFTALVPPSLDGIGSSAAGVLARQLAGEPEFMDLIVVRGDGAPVFALGTGSPADERLTACLRDGAESVWLPSGEGVLIRYAPIIRDGATVGASRLILSLAGERQMLAHSRHLFLAYFALDFLLLLAVGSLLLSRFIIIPMRKLLAATERIGAGDYHHKAAVPGSREIAELADSFNQMVDALRVKDEEAVRHVASLERANRELKEAREETLRSEKMASVGMLAAGTAHEIGTPLAAIMGYVSLLRDDESLDPERADYLRRIQHETERIDRIVHDLLDYARPAPLAAEEVDVADLVAETVEMVSRQGALKRLQVHIGAGEGSAVAVTDPHQLQQVLINLLINARDAMPDGGRLDATVSTGMFMPPAGLPDNGHWSVMAGRRKDDFGGVFRTPFAGDGSEVPCIRIAVTDTGSGIAPEHLERIFDPFFTTKEPGRGTGLGLAISARIIDSLGGRMTVESAVGEGARFEIWLPLSK